MTNLFNLKFWFTINPGPLSATSLKSFLFLIVLLVVSGILMKFFIIKSKERLHRRLYRKIQSLIVTNTFLLMVLFFLMYEAVPFLASRFWFIILLAIDIVWLFLIYKFYKGIPEKKEELKKANEYDKYLP